MHEQSCPSCDNTMAILPCAPNIDWDTLAMGDSASPEAIAHFDRKHREKAAQEKKEAGYDT